MTTTWPAPWETTEALISTRRHVSPKRLVAPAPSEAQLQALFGLAAAAPDHGELTPWRFIVVPPARRDRLGEAFAQALLDRDPKASAQEVSDAREKAQRAPLLMLAVARLGAGDAGAEIPDTERLVSLGCAIQNLLLGAHALGFGTGLTSGQAMRSARLQRLFGLEPGETPVCCINVGTVAKVKNSGRERPAPEAFTRTL